MQDLKTWLRVVMSAPAADMTLILARLDDLARMVQGKHVSPWMTTAEVANYLRCSLRKVEQLTRLGLLPYNRQDSTCSRSPRLYHRLHLTAYLVSGKNAMKHRLWPEGKRRVEEVL